MDRLVKIHLTTKAELSLFRNKLSIFFDYLELDEPTANKVIKLVLEIGFDLIFEGMNLFLPETLLILRMITI